MADIEEDTCFGIIICGSALLLPFPTLNLIKSHNKNIILKFFILLLNFILTPFILIYHSLRIYLLPCFHIIFDNCCCNLIFLCKCLHSCLKYTDKRFPPSPISIGNIKASSEINNIEWIRIPDLELPDNEKVECLFDYISPDNIAQGALGDCWILAAFAALAEQPHLIRACFVTKSYNNRGKYKIRLYDQRISKFIYITVDDYIPCVDSKPLFSKLSKPYQMWPMLLEKAIAKFRGSYAAIEGGDHIDAMRMLTGFESMCINDPLDDNVFKAIQKFSKNCLLCASSDRIINNKDTKDQSGIVAGHAYSILSVHTPRLTTSNIRILELRNPWGIFEWNGDWSDKSDLWSKYPGVSLEIGKPSVKDDGIFYMSWEDFIKNFSRIGIIFPDNSLNSLRIGVNESKGVCGPIHACSKGCIYFWCMCGGFYKLWFSKSSYELKVDLNQVDEKNCCTSTKVQVDLFSP